MNADKRNVLDEFKGMNHSDIVSLLDQRGVELEVAIENLERDFNMGTIVRSANAFGVRRVHVIGRRQWNKRGAMMTDKYLEVIYHATPESFADHAISRDKVIVAIENNHQSESLLDAKLPQKAVLVFGSESGGITRDLLQVSDRIISIPQLGSTRSLNVGVAAGIAMWEWLRQSS